MLQVLARYLSVTHAYLSRDIWPRPIIYARGQIALTLLHFVYNGAQHGLELFSRFT